MKRKPRGTRKRTKENKFFVVVGHAVAPPHEGHVPQEDSPPSSTSPRPSSAATKPGPEEETAAMSEGGW